jgi:SP family myo-inositol transporter-like MFS transporter 13
MMAIILYLTFFSISLGPIPWAVNSEIYPLHLRSLGNSVSTTVNWLSNFIVSQFFLSVTTTTIGQSLTFAGIGLCCAGTWWFVRKFVPETKGKSIEEIVNEICPDVKERIPLKGASATKGAGEMSIN